MYQNRENESSPVSYQPQVRNYTGAIVTISMLIAFLFAGNLYTLDRLNTARQEESDLRSRLGSEIKEVKGQNQDLLMRYARLKDSDARQIAGLSSQLDYATKWLGKSTRQMLVRSRDMASALHELEARQSNVQQAQRSNAEDLAGVVESVSSTQSQLGSTQRTVGVLTQDLGSARSELGEMAAAADVKIQAMQDLMEGQYQEFTLEKGRALHMGPLGMELRQASARDQLFSLELKINDQQIHNPKHSALVPISFYLPGTSAPCEVVVTAIGTDSVAGYVRFPKAAGLESEVSSNSWRAGTMNDITRP